MANVCYTTYKIEGPAEEITAICSYIKKMQALNDRDEQDYPFRNCNEKASERRFNRRLDTYGSSFLIGTQLVSQLTPDCITDLSDGWQVLSIELSSRWSPSPSVVESMLKRVAPSCLFYYYGEEFGCNIAQTNDLHKKYFHADYAIEAHFPQPEKTPKSLLQAFARKDTLRKREDQYNCYFSYYSKRELRANLLDFVPNCRNLGMMSLINAFDNYCNKLYTRSRAAIHIIKIKRIKPENDRPCTHCKQLSRLYSENYDLRERNNKLADILLHYFLHRHEEYREFINSPENYETLYLIDHCKRLMAERKNKKQPANNSPYTDTAPGQVP